MVGFLHIKEIEMKIITNIKTAIEQLKDTVLSQNVIKDILFQCFIIEAQFPKEIENKIVLLNQNEYYDTNNITSEYEEDIDNYVNTEPILLLIASCGSSNGMNKLVRIMLQKLSSSEAEDVVWRIIPKLHCLKKADAKMLSTAIECLELHHLSNEDKKQYIEMIHKITSNE